MIVAVAVLVVLVALGLAVKVMSLPCWGVERYTISVRDFPNVAPEFDPPVTAEAQPTARRACVSGRPVEGGAVA